MGFDQRLLNANEEILLDLRPHWLFMVPPVAVVVGIALVGSAAIGLGAPGLVTLIIAAMLVLGALNLVWRWLVWNGNNFVITTDRLIHRNGVLAKTGIEIPLERINTVFFNQSIFERLIGSGDLTVESAGEGGQQHFANVRRPNHVQQSIYQAMEINKNEEFEAMANANAASQSPAPAPASIPQQIEQLDQLRIRGVVTEEEFQTKKRELLDRM